MGCPGVRENGPKVRLRQNWAGFRGFVESKIIFLWGFSRDFWWGCPGGVKMGQNTPSAKLGQKAQTLGLTHINSLLNPFTHYIFAEMSINKNKKICLLCINENSYIII